LPQSHLPVRHLIRQLEQEGRSPKLAIPAWIVTLIDDAAQLFQPFRGEARAGYECVQIGEEWEISLFLGANEAMGGADDGRRNAVNFRFDIKSLLNLFDTVASTFWSAMPDSRDFFEEESMVSFIALEGQKNGTTIRLQLHATSPQEADPGLRRYTDGRCELV
jgi:hypothetical protein